MQTLILCGDPWLRRAAGVFGILFFSLMAASVAAAPTDFDFSAMTQRIQGWVADFSWVDPQIRRSMEPIPK